jgi:outer membrane protein TolC
MLNKLILIAGLLWPGINLFAQQPVSDTASVALAEALQEAMTNNELLKKAAARIKAGQAVLDQAGGERLPKVDANFTYGYLDIVPGFKKVVLGNIQHDFSPTISINQPLYTGGRLQYTKEVAAAELGSLEQSFLSEQLNLKLSVNVDYFQLQSLINQKQILVENRKQLEIHQRYARLLVEAGRMSQLELDRLAVTLASVEGSLLKTDDDFQTLSFELSLLMGRKEPQVLLPRDTLQVLPFDQNPETLVETSLQHNPVWKQLQWELRKAEAKVKIQQAARLPQVSAQAYYGYEFGPESFSFDKNKRYYWGLNARMPLFDGRVIASKVEESKAGLEQIQWQQEYFQKNLVAQVQNGYSRLKEREQQIHIQDQALDHAEQSYRLALIEYHAGRRSNTDLLEIQKTLLTSRLTLNQSILEYNTARARLLAIMGTL